MELSEILEFPAIKNVDEFEIEGSNNPFYKRAEALMCEYRIKKVSGKCEPRFYFINDIELYYYSKEHKDRYTHVHFYKGEKFRIHQYGVDITFDAKWTKEMDMDNETAHKKVKELLEKKNRWPDNNQLLYYHQIEAFVESNAVSFGGLLLKGIQEENAKYGIQGPVKVQSELFYMEGDTLELQLCKCPSVRTGKIIPLKRDFDRNKKNPAQESDSKPIINGWVEREVFKNHFKRYSFKKTE